MLVVQTFCRHTVSFFKLVFFPKLNEFGSHIASVVNNYKRPKSDKRNHNNLL